MPGSTKMSIALLILVILCIILGLIIGWRMCIDNYTGKFCPECGNRFSSSASYCDIDGAELREIHNRE
jgi:hypothetical protein